MSAWSCDDVRARLPELVDHELLATGLSAELASRMRAHLAACMPCSARVAHERALRRRLQAVRQEEAPESLRRRVRQSLDDRESDDREPGDR